MRRGVERPKGIGRSALLLLLSVHRGQVESPDSLTGYNHLPRLAGAGLIERDYFLRRYVATDDGRRLLFDLRYDLEKWGR